MLLRIYMTVCIELFTHNICMATKVFGDQAMND